MLSSAIALLCAGMVTSGTNSQAACNKGFEAASIQYGIEQKASYYGKRVENAAKEQVNDKVGALMIAGYTALIAKEARISTGKVPFVQSTSLVLRPNSALLTLSWNF